MKKYTFRIDNKDSLCKKLIKLPIAYYILKRNDNVYTVHSHSGMVRVGDDADDLKLKLEKNSIVLCKGNSPLQLNGENFIIEQEAITSVSRDDIINKLRTKSIGISLYDIKDVPYFGMELSISRHNAENGVLNFINFDDENDPVLQKIKEETGGLYFTIEDNADCSRTVYISDKDGNRLPAHNGYQYQYKPNVAELETIDSLIKAEQKFTLQKGQELSDDIYGANIVLNGKTVATLPKIGYYMFNGQLVMRSHITDEEVKIPRDFHYLKVVKPSNNEDYKLTFCNFLGNEFFEYKKYDPQYSNVPNEYQYINLNCMKKEYKPNFCKLLNHKPSFFITEGTANPNSPNHCPAYAFELTNSGKGKKMATLIDQFGFFQ